MSNKYFSFWNPQFTNTLTVGDIKRIEMHERMHEKAYTAIHKLSDAEIARRNKELDDKIAEMINEAKNIN